MASPAKDARDKAQAKWPGASVFARTRNGIIHTHPDNPTPGIEDEGNRTMVDVEIGPLHFGPSEDQEIDTAWQPGTAPWDREMVLADYNAFALDDFSSGQIVKYVDPASGDSVTFQPQQLQWTNDLDQIQPIADPQSVMAVVTDDELYWTGAYGPDIDLKWQTQTARLDKRLIIHNRAAIIQNVPPLVPDDPDLFPAQFIRDGGNPVLRLQFIFQHSNGVSLFVDDVEWNERANNPVETSGYVAFKNSVGEVLWSFNLPRSEDPDEEFIGTFRFRKTGPNLFVEHLIPVSWLQSASYPVEIDVTVDVQVGAGADDGSFGSAAGYSNTGVTDTLSASNTADRNWYRWSSVTITDGVTIDVAYFEIYLRDIETNEDTDVFFEDSGTPAAPTGQADGEGKTRTTATVNWLVSNGAGNQFVQSDSIVGIVQELEDSYDYSGGAAMQVIHEGDSMAGAIRCRTYDQDTAKAAKLHIEYTAGGGGVPIFGAAHHYQRIYLEP